LDERGVELERGKERGMGNRRSWRDGRREGK
jgi:hypothetical protein